jgi:hypothetical protein
MKNNLLVLSCTLILLVASSLCAKFSDIIAAPVNAVGTTVTLGAAPYGGDGDPAGPNARRFFGSPFKAAGTVVTLGAYPLDQTGQK